MGKTTGNYEAWSQTSEKMLKMEFEDFKKETVECLGFLWVMAQAKDELLNLAFRERDGKLDALTTVVGILASRVPGGQAAQKEMLAILESKIHKAEERLAELQAAQ